jgi:dephospho-CoA kinase
MKVVAVFSPPEMRYDRLVDRAVANDEKQRFRSFTREESKARDYAEIENIEKGGPIAMASYTIINTGTVLELKGEIEKIIGEI